MSRLQQILRRKDARRARLASALDSIVRQLIDLGAVKIILFGSFARGEVDVGSDLDLLVLMPSTKTGKEWSKDIYRRVERDVAADILVYNEREFHENLPVSHFLQGVAGGRVLYEKAV